MTVQIKLGQRVDSILGILRPLRDQDSGEHLVDSGILRELGLLLCVGHGGH